MEYPTVEVVVKKQVEIKSLLIKCEPRHWEDATYNGVDENEDDPKMPMKVGSMLVMKIDLLTGKIENWPKGNTASIVYKVCDAGSYYLLDANDDVVLSIEAGYVPDMATIPRAFGDYIIMQIDEDGKIENWKVDLTGFGDN